MFSKISVMDLIHILLLDSTIASKDGVAYKLCCLFVCYFRERDEE